MICPSEPPSRSRARGDSPQNGMPMLLCPEQSHTSPTRTSLTATPLAASVRPSQLAGIGSRSTRQRPSAAAVADFDCPANVTVTASPASAVPQTGTFASRWRMAPSVNGAANFTAASNIVMLFISFCLHDLMSTC